MEIFNALKKLPKKDSSDVGVNVGESVGVNEERMLSALKADGRATAKELAEVLNSSSRRAERILKSLKGKGLIRCVGSDKSGHREVQ